MINNPGKKPYLSTNEQSSFSKGTTLMLQNITLYNTSILCLHLSLLYALHNLSYSQNTRATSVFNIYLALFFLFFKIRSFYTAYCSILFFFILIQPQNIDRKVYLLSI